jgi:predicted ATPase
MAHLHVPRDHANRRIVITGGPGAGKTAILDLARRSLCEHVTIVPEAASILFGGGFPRRRDDVARAAAQRAIYHVQVELETALAVGAGAALALCDRGTVDGAAYWPGPIDEFFGHVGTTIEAEFSRYHTVIHLRTPPDGRYTHNALRIESAAEAAAIDERIAAVWHHHPRYFVVESTGKFMVKAGRALELIRAELPACCEGGA